MAHYHENKNILLLDNIIRKELKNSKRLHAGYELEAIEAYLTKI